jgi:hypothetical protein
MLSERRDMSARCAILRSCRVSNACARPLKLIVRGHDKTRDVRCRRNCRVAETLCRVSTLSAMVMVDILATGRYRAHSIASGLGASDSVRTSCAGALARCGAPPAL